MFLRNPKENLALLSRSTRFLTVICGNCEGRTGTPILKENTHHTMTNATAAVRLTGTLSSYTIQLNQQTFFSKLGVDMVVALSSKG